MVMSRVLAGWLHTLHLIFIPQRHQAGVDQRIDGELGSSKGTPVRFVYVKE